MTRLTCCMLFIPVKLSTQITLQNNTTHWTSMFQNNPLLAKLKKQLHVSAPKIEGIVKGTEKGFGFLEIDAQKSYFIPPPQMKKVMHGDRVQGSLYNDRDREMVQPETLLEPFLSRFVGRVQKRGTFLLIRPDHPLLKEAIPCYVSADIAHSFEEGDWAVAEMREHPLKGARAFKAEITSFISHGEDNFAPWWVTLTRHNLERTPPDMCPLALNETESEREDLTDLNFITIDNASTEDMDDALCVSDLGNGSFMLMVAIADPTAYIDENSPLDTAARQRAFTTYLPGFDIPMLPREVADDICSLRPDQRRPALICRVTITPEGALGEDIRFSSAWITSKAKLAYNKVSDWLENQGDWAPPNTEIAEQIQWLKHIYDVRHHWRQQHALVFKNRSEYRFVINENGNVLDVIIDERRIAHGIVEECMIAANICAAVILRDCLGFGFYNVHRGFDPALVKQAAQILKTHGIEFPPADLLTLEGFCQLRRQLDSLGNEALESRLRRLQAFSELSVEPGPHFGLGLPLYATWTSPIRKYSDMVNHRLLKMVIANRSAKKLDENISELIAERRRANRMAERDISDWLYARYLNPIAGTDKNFSAKIMEMTRGGLRVRLLENGAIAFIPASLIHSVRSEIVFNSEMGTVYKNEDIIYRQGDMIEVQLAQVRLDTRNLIARPI